MQPTPYVRHGPAWMLNNSDSGGCAQGAPRQPAAHPASISEHTDTAARGQQF